MKFFKSNKFSWIVVFISAFISFSYFQERANPKVHNLNYNQFLTELNNGQVHTLYIKNNITGAKEIVFFSKSEASKDDKQKEYKRVITPSFEQFWNKFSSNANYKDIIVEMKPLPVEPIWLTLIKSILPIVVFVLLFVAIQRMAMGGIGKGTANELLDPKKIDVTFSDIIGIDEVKEEVQEIVGFLKNTEKFTKHGAKMPKGIILSGAPGTGKTMLAKALAKEANVPFYYCSGSSFVEMFVGVGASRVRSMFEKAKKASPCIIFIDEIDSIGGARDKQMSIGSNSERENTLNELLVQMDGMESNNGVFIIAATNRVENLDKALLRPGRFDRQIVVPLPNMDGRVELITKLCKQYKIAEDFNIKEAAKGMTGMSSASITNVMNEAAIIQVRQNKEALDKTCFSEALDKVIMGMTNGHKLTEKDKIVTAYHEAGHAVIGLFLKNTDPVHKVTIVPRGRALGVTMSIPEEDRVSYTRSYLLDQISMLYGGFCAEAMFIGDITTGASNDIERVTSIVKNMVAVWGLNDNLRQYVYLDNHESTMSLSDATKQRIENEIEDILATQKQVAMDILKQYEHVMHNMVDMLLEKEVIAESDILQILKQSNIPESQIPEYLLK